MGFFDLFRKKKEIEIREPPKPEPILQELNNEGRTFIEDNCEVCNQQIGINKWRKVAGKFMHKSCFKKQVKFLKQQGKLA